LSPFRESEDLRITGAHIEGKAHSLASVRELSGSGSGAHAADWLDWAPQLSAHGALHPRRANRQFLTFTTGSDAGGIAPFVGVERQSVADAVQGLLASAPRPGALCAMPIVPSRCERRSSSFSTRDDLRRDSSDPSATVRHRLATVCRRRQGPTQRAPKTLRSVRRRQTAQFRPRRFR
jgi:hypothetical protein